MPNYDTLNEKDCRHNAIGYRAGGDMNQIKLQYGEKSEGRHFVLWSGGCDSTLLLYELIDAYGCENVVAVSYSYPWLTDEKLKSEEMHRNSFKANIAIRDKKFRSINHMHISVNYNLESSVDGAEVNMQHGGTIQPVAWLLSIANFTRTGDYIYIGTLKGDDLPITLPEFQTAVKNISKVLARDIQLRTPYIYLCKEDVIRKLMEYDLYQHVWYCEMTEEANVRCGKCTPCKTHLKALNSLLATEDDPIIAEKARKEFKALYELYTKTPEEKKIQLKEPEKDES